jgi:hypothetical protein
MDVFPSIAAVFAVVFAVQGAVYAAANAPKDGSLDTFRLSAGRTCTCICHPAPTAGYSRHVLRSRIACTPNTAHGTVRSTKENAAEQSVGRGAAEHVVPEVNVDWQRTSQHDRYAMI